MVCESFVRPLSTGYDGIQCFILSSGMLSISWRRLCSTQLSPEPQSFLLQN